MSEKNGICISSAVIIIIWLKIVNLIFYCRKNVSNNGINSNLIVFSQIFALFLYYRLQFLQECGNICKTIKYWRNKKWEKS